MGAQTVFKRYELKYMLTQAQKEKVLAAMAPYMVLDAYGRTTIRNIYFDTGDYRLIRHSLEHPAYKEKLRIRSYSQASPDSPVFVELKKKYQHVVYKRRIAMTEKQAIDWVCGGATRPQDTQIAREIDYFLSFYNTLHSVAFLSYEREAYYALDGSDFRVTFDDHILSRQDELTLEAEVWGQRLMPEEMTLMEIKCSGGMPMWMAHVLSQERIFKTSFSKYGAAYQQLIYPKMKEASCYA